MRHRTLFVASASIAVLLAVLLASPLHAQVITDLSYDLAALSEPELLVDWAAFGTGVRMGIRVTNTAGNNRFYTNNTLVLDNGEAFLMDVVMSAQALSADGDRGARIWVQFRDPTAPPMQFRLAEARLYRESGTYRVGLYNSSGPASPLASLPQDWTSTAPRLRVRIRYQEVAGVPTIFLAAEDSTQWAPDLSGPLTPDSSNTLSLPVNNTLFPAVPGSSEFGFGNYVAGSYYADYETVRIIRSSEPDTVLPALLALDIPTLATPAILVLVTLLAVAGWFLVVRGHF